MRTEFTTVIMINDDCRLMATLDWPPHQIAWETTIAICWTGVGWNFWWLILAIQWINATLKNCNIFPGQLEMLFWDQAISNVFAWTLRKAQDQSWSGKERNHELSKRFICRKVCRSLICLTHHTRVYSSWAECLS